MKILQLIETAEPGGAETLVVNLAKGHRSKGHNCIIGLLETGWLDSILSQEGFETIVVEERGRFDLQCIVELSKIIRTFKIDLVHSHEFLMNIYGTAAAVINKIPVITTVHGKNYYYAKRRRRLAYRLISRLSTMVAVGDDVKCILEDRVGIKHGRVRRIYNGVDCDQYSSPESEAASTGIRACLSIPADCPVIGTVGMLVPVKGHNTLLRAARMVVEYHPDAIFLVVGDGPLKADLIAEACRLGIEANVRFTGFRSDIRNLISMVDLYVCSSVSEGISLSILEAMAAGKPVIATSVGGNKEIVVNDETGILVKADDPSSMAIKIISLLRNGQRARELGLNGRRRVNDEFSLQRMQDSYHGLYEDRFIRS